MGHELLTFGHRDAKSAVPRKADTSQPEFLAGRRSGQLTQKPFHLGHNCLSAPDVLIVPPGRALNVGAAVWTRNLPRPDIRIATPAQFQAGRNASFLWRFPQLPFVSELH